MNDIHLTDRQELIMLMVRDRKMLQHMAETCWVSLRTIQKEMEFLIDLGLVERIKNERGKTKMGGRRLTSQGKGWLKEHGHKYETIT